MNDDPATLRLRRVMSSAFAMALNVAVHGWTPGYEIALDGLARSWRGCASGEMS